MIVGHNAIHNKHDICSNYIGKYQGFFFNEKQITANEKTFTILYVNS